MVEFARPAAVVFDLDGLMFNTEELYEDVGAELLRRRGKAMTRGLLDEMMGRPSPVALQIMIDWHGLDATVAELEADTDALFAKILATRLAPMPGLLDLMAALEAAGIPKAIATSSRRAFVDQVLGHFDFARRFQFVLTCEDVNRGKPHPEVYQTAARRFGIEPPRMLVLEDSQIGCRAAVAASAVAVAVPGEHSLRHDFTGAALVADSLADPRIYQVIGL
jgi:HAD superfamily hydrolase (TIGR01509 family)